MNAGISRSPSCNDLPLAGIIPFSATDWPGRLTVSVFTQGCPWRCVYCHNPGLQEFGEGESTMSRALELMERRRQLIDALVITGGEPLAHAALPAAIAAAHDHGFSVGLHTCGYAPRRMRGLLETADTRPDWIGLDIKGLPGDMPGVAGCTPRAALAAWETLDIIGSSGVAVQVRTTVWPGGIVDRHLSRLRAEVAERGHELVIQNARGVDSYGNYLQVT
ncbi:anaerobic ribonucleoside-triphosphate reductase activating protein [Corynebacterium pacaense]|uniref:anaerobic ribonucleoside-triphosphate reductase activating protein n=1 Tax=Corynebacterium pacaense TaxID=1816684 RepID=UPI0009BC0AB4|nr:anaerobic ribonucleoside-triphosphate reductase activating protein [Corynebacterium pacaense]